MGLFARMTGGEMKNLGINNTLISSVGGSVGSLIGSMTGGKLENIHARGLNTRSETSDLVTYRRVGGFIGSLDGASTTLSNITATVNVTSNVNRVGGLFGTMNQPRLDRVSVQGSVTGNGGESFVGGMAGGSYQSTLNEVIAEVNVESTYSAGVFIGQFTQNQTLVHIRNVYIKGKVVAEKCAGGFAGDIGLPGGLYLANTYVNVDVEANKVSAMGTCNSGLSGHQWYEGVRILGKLRGVGSDSLVRSYGTSVRSTANTYNHLDMPIGSYNTYPSTNRPAEFFTTKAGYEGWDFDTIWDWDSNKNGGHPTLKWAN